jgi:hypothetical protein
MAVLLECHSSRLVVVLNEVMGCLLSDVTGNDVAFADENFNQQDQEDTCIFSP